MQKEPDFERIRKTLFLEEPDRVPLAEVHIDPSIKEGYLGRAIITLEDEVEFWTEAHYDYVMWFFSELGKL